MESGKITMSGKCVLALDTATDILSAALAAESREYLVEIDAGASYADRLFDAIDALFALARIEREALDLVLCMKGPGAWTGLRIGFSTAQGLAFALGKPAAALPTLDSIAFPHRGFDGVVLPALDAKQGKFFCALYEHGALCGGYRDASPHEIAAALPPDRPALLTGPDAPALFAALSTLMPDAPFVLDSPRRRGYAAALLRLAQETPGLLDAPPAQTRELLYLRASDAERGRTSTSQPPLTAAPPLDGREAVGAERFVVGGSGARIWRGLDCRTPNGSAPTASRPSRGPPLASGSVGCGIAWRVLTLQTSRCPPGCWLFAQAIAAERPEAARRGAEDLERKARSAASRRMRPNGCHVSCQFSVAGCQQTAGFQISDFGFLKTALKPPPLLRQRAEDGALSERGASMKTGRVAGPRAPSPCSKVSGMLHSWYEPER
jgi:tRNA threonylcarbamoyladenosine biosynthesis protein TsaB